MKRYYIFFAILVAFSAVTILTNSALRRGPVHDTTAAQDIRIIQSAVDSYFISQNRLPETLGQVDLDGTETASRRGDYEYVRTAPDKYELCTTFLTKHASRDSYYAQEKTPTGIVLPMPENHDKGRQCFKYVAIPITGQQLIPSR